MSAVAHGLLPVKTSESVSFWPVDDVALILDEYVGRVTVVHADGSVGHRPGPLEDFGDPWVPVAPGAPGAIVHPAHVRFEGGRCVGPGGWGFPARSISRVRRKAEAPEAVIPELGVTAGDVLYVRSQEKKPVFVTAEREIHLRGVPSFAYAQTLVPELVRVGRIFVQPRSLRAVVGERRRYRLTLGPRGVTVPRASARALASALGLETLDEVGPMSEQHRRVYAEGLRDYPFELMRASKETLRELFHADPRAATLAVVWQAYRMRCAGGADDYGRDLRGFWYRPLLPVLGRMGLRSGGEHGVVLSLLGPAVAASLYADSRDPMYDLYRALVAQMVGDWRLFTYRELGFDDPRPDLRGIGETRPEVLVYAEKASLLREVRRLGDELGVSFMVSGGMSAWIAAEYLAEALRERIGKRKVRLVAYVDFDPDGWAMVDVFVKHLARYGVEVDGVAWLIRPERFTADEIEAVARPLIPADDGQRTKILDWLKRSGGIRGRGYGIHADHLRPYERVAKALRELLGLR